MTHDRQLVQTRLSVEQDDTGCQHPVLYDFGDLLSVPQMTMNNITNLEIPRSPLSRLFMLHHVQRQPDRVTELVFGFEQVSTRVHL
jgi:hypothetical protein